MSTPPALEVRRLVAGWGADDVLQGVDLQVPDAETVAVLGGNGSGKSTLLAVLAGVLRPRAGTVLVCGRVLHRRLRRTPPERVAAAGVRLMPQARRVFASLSVEENLRSPGFAAPRAQRQHVAAWSREWLERHPALAARRDQPAAGLSGGQQQLLALGRVLALPARVLLLDEPSAGLAPAAVDDVVEVLRARAATGTTVVLVEQDVAVAERLAGRVLRLAGGRLEPAG